MLARNEARLTINKVIHMNKALLPLKQGRTLESMKSQRRQLVYKQLVQRYIDEIQHSTPTVQTRANNTDNNTDNNTESLLRALSQGQGASEERFNARVLLEICLKAPTTSVDELLAEVDSYLSRTFPEKRDPNHRVRKEKNDPPKLSKRKQRRIEYSKVQAAWGKNPCKSIKTLLDDNSADSNIEPDLLTQYWQNVFTTRNDNTPGHDGETQIGHSNIWRPIEIEELRYGMPANNTAPGPDGVTARLLKSIPTVVLRNLFNIIMYIGRLPNKLLESYTTMIPKKAKAT
ncbi:MAG: hypothetical protein PV362_17185, partial [Providencia heimbachae]|nr:hypothetical protein [Providencia heimbachae]